ncbi:macrophage mannose receptor 1-like [Silurus meridionalis]|uniref:C-type lectin domain-containing protein n=1 Tax=Silurus meridionalis TaxID=175797 RepID=A0A8T0BWJ0_SILME|nr:macrophage mannose receptor 1-like [Silurus meridionalis]KAF7710793.1 hypothetical protein HF521_009665 [Silurus meridionalis]KAI5108394.1 lymphocyte antigen 75-like [Silurus meridionalis]
MTEGLLREYINDNLYKNWTDARNYCMRNYRGLAVITNEEEYERVQQIAGPAGSGWIGLHRSVMNSSEWLWDDGKENSYFPWMTGQPNNFNGTQDCIQITPSGWNDFHCWTIQSFYCYRFIILVEEKKTWEQALDYCRVHYKNMAYPTTNSQLQLAEQEAIQNQVNLVWTGMRFLNRNWYWVNGKQLNSSISMPSCPGSQSGCGARNIRTHVWENRLCDEKLPFLCYW